MVCTDATRLGFVVVSRLVFGSLFRAQLVWSGMKAGGGRESKYKSKSKSIYPQTRGYPEGK
uniref:HDC11211 n=1 Tax=Drosophila melanogaster TaxID=7227 RepID=Q6IKW9_DROME|nr:TPA_inf: HDC11211 [Drosophila melanogaster]